MRDPLLLFIRYRLRQWGRWYCRVLTADLDYSGQSCIDRLQKNGGLVIRSTARSLVPPHPDAEEVDEAIEMLAKPMPEGLGQIEYAQVLRAHYTLIDKPEADKVVASKCSRRTYYRYLKKGEAYLSHILLGHSSS